jgi:hypothetical protein
VADQITEGVTVDIGIDLGSLAPITEDEQDELIERLVHHYDSFKNSVKPLHDKIDKWHKLYEAIKKEKKKFPWPNSSNFTTPLIMSVVDSLHARLVKAIFEVDPIWLAKARTPEGVGRATKAQWYLDYWADEMEVPKRLDQLLLNMLIEGVGVLKTDWVRQTRQIPQQQLGPFDSAPTEVVEYEGPSAYPVPLKDFVLIPADSPTIEEAVYVGHRVWRTAEQLRQREQDGFYFNVSRLIERGEDSDKTEKAKHPSGLVNPSSHNGRYEEVQQFELVELFGQFDFGDGLKPTLFTFSPEHKILLRIEPYPYEYGRAPYIDFSVYPRSNFFWARSVPEILESVQEELTALHNMRADAIVRRITPPILKRMGSLWDHEENPMVPGGVYEVTDTEEIKELVLAPVDSASFAHGQELIAYTERVTGMSDFFMGRMSNQHATATAVNRVTSEGLARVDVMVSRIQQSLTTFAWTIWWLLYQYRPMMDTFHAENQDMSITKAEMRPTEQGLMPFEFVPQGKLSDASREAQRQQLMMLLQITAPYLQQFYPDGLQHMLDKIMQSFDVQDRSVVLGPPWNALQGQIQQIAQQAYQQGAKDTAQGGD